MAFLRVSWLSLGGWARNHSLPCYMYIYHAHISLKWKKNLFILKKLLCQEGSSKRNFLTHRQAIGYGSGPETWLCTRLTWGHVKQNPRPHPRAADSLDLRWSPGICISGALPGAAGAAGFGTPLTTSALWLLCGDCPLAVAVFSPSTGVQPQLDPGYPKRGRRWRWEIYLFRDIEGDKDLLKDI